LLAQLITVATLWPGLIPASTPIARSDYTGFQDVDTRVRSESWSQFFAMLWVIG
jgi:hypothetical protein